MKKYKVDKKYTPGMFADTRKTGDAPAFPSVWRSSRKSADFRGDDDDTCLVAQTMGTSDECKANAQLFAGADALVEAALPLATKGMFIAEYILGDEARFVAVDVDQLRAIRDALVKCGVMVEIQDKA